MNRRNVFACVFAVFVTVVSISVNNAFASRLDPSLALTSSAHRAKRALEITASPKEDSERKYSPFKNGQSISPLPPFPKFTSQIPVGSQSSATGTSPLWYPPHWYQQPQYTFGPGTYPEYPMRRPPLRLPEHPSQLPWQTHQPSQSKWQTQQPSESMWQTQQPSESMWQTQKPSQSKWQTQQPSESMWQTQKPSQSMWQTQQPSESMWQTQQPSQSLWQPEQPSESLWQTEKLYGSPHVPLASLNWPEQGPQSFHMPPHLLKLPEQQHTVVPSDFLHQSEAPSETNPEETPFDLPSEAEPEPASVFETPSESEALPEPETTDWISDLPPEPTISDSPDSERESPIEPAISPEPVEDAHMEEHSPENEIPLDLPEMPIQELDIQAPSSLSQESFLPELPQEPFVSELPQESYLYELPPEDSLQSLDEPPRYLPGNNNHFAVRDAEYSMALLRFTQRVLKASMDSMLSTAFQLAVRPDH